MLWRITSRCCRLQCLSIPETLNPKTLGFPRPLTNLTTLIYSAGETKRHHRCRRHRRLQQETYFGFKHGWHVHMIHNNGCLLIMQALQQRNGNERRKRRKRMAAMRRRRKNLSTVRKMMPMSPRRRRMMTMLGQRTMSRLQSGRSETSVVFVRDCRAGVCMVCSRQSRQSCMHAVHIFTCTHFYMHFARDTRPCPSMHIHTHAWVLCSFACETLDELKSG